MKAPEQQPRDWIPLLLALAIVYLVLLLPFAAVIGAKPEVIGGAIAALTTALAGILTARSLRK